MEMLLIGWETNIGWLERMQIENVVYTFTKLPF
mgnify:CR=1 FL=1